MIYLFIAIAFVFVIAIGIFSSVIISKINAITKTSNNDALLSWLKTMHQTLEETNKVVHQTLSSNSMEMVKTLQENSKQLNQRLDRSSVVIKEVGEQVGKITEIGRSMRDLEIFLKSPKLRGNIGEEILRDLIAQMLPKNSFFIQYSFKSGDRVDAAIKTNAGILPIDSKFPMEAFLKMSNAQDSTKKTLFQKELISNVKKHIDTIAKKYILPDEGTMNFALMYVPSESVYYELINLQEIMNYAKRNRVYIVSPSTLYAHLQTVLLSFESQKIQTHTNEILKLLKSAQIDHGKLTDSLNILGKHLHNASLQFSNVDLEVKSLGQKVDAVKYLE